MKLLDDITRMIAEEGAKYGYPEGKVANALFMADSILLTVASEMCERSGTHGKEALDHLRKAVASASASELISQLNEDERRQHLAAIVRFAIAEFPVFRS